MKPLLRWIIIALLVGGLGIAVLKRQSREAEVRTPTGERVIALRHEPVRGEISQMVLEDRLPASFEELRSRYVDPGVHEGHEIVRRYAPQATAAASVRLFLESMKEGVDYPFLPLLTKGSQLMRLEYPDAGLGVRTRWETAQQAGTMTLWEDGDLAVARWENRMLADPLFLRRSPEGSWLVDFAKSWSSFRHYCPVHPWREAFSPQPEQENLFPFPDLAPTGADPVEQIHALQERLETDPETAAPYFELASRLYFDASLLRAASTIVEEGLRKSPDSYRYRFLAILILRNAASHEGVREHYEAILQTAPQLEATWDHYYQFAKYTLRDDTLATEILRRKIAARP